MSNHIWVADFLSGTTVDSSRVLPGLGYGRLGCTSVASLKSTLQPSDKVTGGCLRKELAHRKAALLTRLHHCLLLPNVLRGKQSPSASAMHLSRVARDNDPYYTQLLLDRSHALFFTDKSSINSDVRVEDLWSQSKKKGGRFRHKAAQDPATLIRSVWRRLWACEDHYLYRCRFQKSDRCAQRSFAGYYCILTEEHTANVGAVLSPA